MSKIFCIISDIFYLYITFAYANKNALNESCLFGHVFYFVNRLSVFIEDFAYLRLVIAKLFFITLKRLDFHDKPKLREISSMVKTC